MYNVYQMKVLKKNIFLTISTTIIYRKYTMYINVLGLSNESTLKYSSHFQ